MHYKEINGIQTHAPFSRQELIKYANKEKKILVAVNAEKILQASSDSRDIINRNLGYPDGIGAVMALKQKGIKNVIKIPGCELWLDIIKEFYEGKSFYLIGGREEVVQKTVLKLENNYPGIKILNFRNGYLNTEEKQHLILDICQKKPDVVFVAMGSPKQELLMEEMHKVHPALYQGLGGSFDVYTGQVERAPKWWLNNNLEWAYRLVKQPTRIKRQIYLFKFLYLLKMNKL